MMWSANQRILLGNVTSVPGSAAYDVKPETNTQHSPFAFMPPTNRVSSGAAGAEF
jgi:hypothetical protein